MQQHAGYAQSFLNVLFRLPKTSDVYVSRVLEGD